MTIQTPAAPGDLDPSFGNGGKVVTSISGNYAIALDTAIQSDGKIVAVGDSQIGNINRFALARYNTDGSLDTTFGTGGIVVTPFGVSASANAVAIQSDGKIIAAGYGSTPYTAFTLVRYNTDGSLDTTFGAGGVVHTFFPIPVFNDSYISDIAIQSDGKIVAAGTVNDYNEYETSFAFARYNTDGSLDASFGTGGIVTTGFNFGQNSVFAVAIQSDGKIVAAGISNGFVLARFNTDGSLDTTFGTGGFVSNFSQSGFGWAEAVAIQPDGRIVAVGRSYNAINFALARFNTDGSLDITFGLGGIVRTLVGESSSSSALAIQSNGKIVVAGEGRIGSNPNFALARYNTDGSLDTSFGSGGKVLTPFGSRSLAWAVAIQPDGKIVAAGFSNNGTNYDFALVRYLGDSNTKHLAKSNAVFRTNSF